MQKKENHILKFLRDYYKPIQPTVSKTNSEISYQEISPSVAIENYVYCFWQLKTKKKLSENYKYRVVSDGCIDIFFNHQKPIENFIMGFCKKYTHFEIGKEFDYIGIRFLPSAFPLLFGIDAKTLSNQSLELNEVLPNFSNWIHTTITSSDSFEIISKNINNKIISYLKNKEIYYDHRFLDALQKIFHKNGYLDTEKELHTGLSPRQLRRIFNFYIGTTAKSFSNVVRFQYILNRKPSKQSLKNNKPYYDVGFFDQAHFIKSFKTFYGITPSEAFD